jgi:hypothetical protein
MGWRKRVGCVVLAGEVVCGVGSSNSCRCGRGRKEKERELIVDMW